MQPYIFSLRENLLLPSEKRFRKVSRISIWIVFLTFVFFSLIVYWCLGDNKIPELTILRLPYLSAFHPVELFYKAILFIYIIVYEISISIFNFTLKTFLQKIFKIENRGFKYILVSTGPFFLAMIVGSIYPDVLGILGFVSLIIGNFNGYIIPALLKIGIYKKEAQK